MSASAHDTDVTAHYSGCMRASAQGYNVLILWKLKVPIRRLDGKLAQYELSHRWLSSPAEVDGVAMPGNLSCVRGSDTTYWTGREIAEWHADLFRNVVLF